MKILGVEFGKEFKLKGKAWIGDPCYIINDKIWTELHGHVFPADWDTLGHRDGYVVKTSEGDFFACATAYGDGSYPVEKVADGVAKGIGDCGVDSGCLALVPSKLVKSFLKSHRGADDKLGVWVKVDGTCSATNGDWTCGDVSVNTSGDGEEDEEDLDEDEDLEDEEDDEDA